MADRTEVEERRERGGSTNGAAKRSDGGSDVHERRTHALAPADGHEGTPLVVLSGRGISVSLLLSPSPGWIHLLWCMNESTPSGGLLCFYVRLCPV
jgi:hypothetical protein